jgi:hypothetical protein
MTNVLFGIVALLVAALLVQGITDSPLAAWAAVVLFIAFVFVLIELWPGSRSRCRKDS